MFLNFEMSVTSANIIIAKKNSFFCSFLIWSDSAVPVERISELKSFQVQNANNVLI